MAKDYQKKNQSASKAGSTSVSAGQTGKTSEEYASELGAGKSSPSQSVTGRVGKSWSPSKEAAEFNEFASELATGKNASQNASQNAASKSPANKKNQS